MADIRTELSWNNETDGGCCLGVPGDMQPCSVHVRVASHRSRDGRRERGIHKSGGLPSLKSIYTNFSGNARILLPFRHLNTGKVRGPARAS